MSCCGQKRQAWRKSEVTRVQPPGSSSPPVLQNPSVLYFFGETSLVIKGTVTGNTYLFADRNTGLSVDERDLPAFLTMDIFKTTLPE